MPLDNKLVLPDKKRPLRLTDLKKRAKEYVELEASTKVSDIRLSRRFTLFGEADVAFLVTTTNRKEPRWWVIGGSSPMNLYSERDFPDVDVAYSLHTGLLLRISERQTAARFTSERFGHHAFICHASEDKTALVRPLARILTRFGYDVWFDEFDLKVGDSLRRSIDKGLANSRYGIVVLSEAFFDKNWPQYELDGLLAREVQGKKVILPIWHGVTRKQVLRYSSSLADKVAVATAGKTVRQVARELAKTLGE
jgi:hypothetical protein